MLNKQINIYIVLCIIFLFSFLFGCKSSNTLSPSPSQKMASVPAIKPTVTPTTPIASAAISIPDFDNYPKIILNNTDFELNYKSVLINSDTKVEDIINKIGYPSDYEDNNKGFISGNAKYRRWNLYYPNFIKPEILIIVLSERVSDASTVKDGNSYIVGINLRTIKSDKGLIAGDDLDKALKLYGKPDKTSIYENGYELIYSKNNLNLEIRIDNKTQKVFNIFINYNMEKSVADQLSADN